MAKVFEGIDERLASFIGAQHMFFVATAPLAGDGHINLSPKGLDTFAILDPSTVAYLDLTGSGVETTAHLRENGRVVIMFCAFSGPPKIVRLYGSGEVIGEGHQDFQGLRARFPEYPGVRGVIRVRLERISDSCGYGVPRYRYEGERTQLLAYYQHQGPEGMIAYREEHNRRSIDGLPGLAPVDAESPAISVPEGAPR